MKCRDAEPLLSSLVDGDLLPARAAALEAHLAACADCRRAREEIAAVAGGLRALPPLDAPAGMWARIDAALDEEASRPALTRFFAAVRRLWLPAAGALAAASLVIALGLRGAPPPPPSDEALWQDAESEFRRAEEHYTRALDDLLQLASRRRPAWTPDRQRRFDEARAALDAAIAKCKGAARKSPGDAEAQELLYRSYREEIAFLQDFLLRPSPPSESPASESPPPASEDRR